MAELTVPPKKRFGLSSLEKHITNEHCHNLGLRPPLPPSFGSAPPTYYVHIHSQAWMGRPTLARVCLR